jgi:hypothetical protein
MNVRQQTVDSELLAAESRLKEHGNTIFGPVPTRPFNAKVQRPITVEERTPVECSVEYPLRVETKRGRFKMFVADPAFGAPFTDLMGDESTGYFKVQIVDGRIEILRQLKNRHW